jgi:stromal membrane-associated protein
MGTHISRVKSVDLDSWTDEQLQSILSWGNARANKYWEAKLAAGHVPSEAKIENFIRTKYELKRWVMEGGLPDPATLDVEGDDDIPLSLVKEKQNIERKESVRKASVGQQAKPRTAAAAPHGDLIGGDPIPQRSSTAGPPSTRVAAKAEPAPPKATSTKDSLLGLDFFGTEVAAPPRPASTSGTMGTGGQSRPDLKQSILSLYATAPRPQAQPQVAQAPGSSFGGLPSPTYGQQPQQQQQQSSMAGFNDAFSGLSFSTQAAPKPAALDPFASLGGNTSPKPAQSSSAFGGLSGGSFFDPKPAPSTNISNSSNQKQPSNSGFGNFSAFSTPAASQPKPVQSSSTAMGDLFDLSSPASPPAAPISNPAPVSTSGSVFNLSSNQPKSPPAATTTAAAATVSASTMGAAPTSSWSNSDVWGNAWSTPDPAPAPATTAAPSLKPAEPPKPAAPAISNDFGWGSPSTSSAGIGGGSLAGQSIVPGASGFAPKVAADEEFGGWTSSTGTSSGGGAAKPASGGFGGGDDLFSNVWQ